MIPVHGATFLVGALLGPAAAGLFRVAREVGTGLMKPAELVNQALYPDIARLVRAGDRRRLARPAVRAGLMASAAGLAVTIIAWSAGELLLGMIFGADYAPAAPLLALLALSTSLRVSVIAADPLLYSLGKAGAPLAVATAANLLFVALLFWWLPDNGLIGAGWAFLTAALFSAAGSALLAWRLAQRSVSSPKQSAAG
jgi:O-antigen/teichoic acid export membrane protein